MHVLITGAHGQLGNELKCLFESGVSEIGPIPEVFVEPDVDYTDADELDITSAEAVNTWFDQHERYDVVINCAAATNVDGCESNFEMAFAVNALGPMNLARACNSTQTKLVQVSTDYIYGCR